MIHLGYVFGQPARKTHFPLRPASHGNDAPQLWVINQDFKFLKTPRPNDIDNWMNDYRRATTNKPAGDVLKNLYRQKNVETLENDLLDLIEEANTKPA